MDKIYIIIVVVISIFVIIPMSIIIYFTLKTPVQTAPVQEMQTTPQAPTPRLMVLTPIKNDNITNLPKILERDNKTQLTSEQLKIKAIYEANVAETQAQKAEKAKK